VKYTLKTPIVVSKRCADGELEERTRDKSQQADAKKCTSSKLGVCRESKSNYERYRKADN